MTSRLDVRERRIECIGRRRTRRYRASHVGKRRKRHLLALLVR
jgi:hypothetical protein